MPKSIKLGDLRVLERKNPDLAIRLREQTDLTDDRFQSDDFAAALKAARQAQFSALEDFLNPEGLQLQDYYDNPGVLVEVADADGNFNGDIRVKIPEGIQRGKPYGVNRYTLERWERRVEPNQHSGDEGTGPMEKYVLFEKLDSEGHLILLALNKVRLASKA